MTELAYNYLTQSWDKLGGLVQDVADHLATRPVEIRWQSPPTEKAVGEAKKTKDGKPIAYIGYLEGLRSRLETFTHECLHCRLDYDILPVSSDRKRPAVRVRRSEAARAEWRANPRELRVQKLTEEVIQYAERNAYKYWRVGRSEIECILLAMLDWSG